MKYIIFIGIVGILGQVNGRIIDPLEHDPLRTSWFLWEDEHGSLRNESLLRQISNQRGGSINDVQLRLYTKFNPKLKNYELINPVTLNDLISSLHFNATRPNIFVIHGWMNDWRSAVNQHICDAMLETWDVNVFVVDWGSIARKFYTTSKAAIPGIGMGLGLYITEMMEHFSIPPEKIMIIGHSLGAHVAGAAGAAMLEQPDLIVGLDPAGPLFSLSNLDTRLDTTDAKHVHIIHTNGGLLAFRSSLGHSDFFPNGGLWQPGCFMDIAGSCAHSRAYKYYAESLRHCEFDAVHCENYNDFKNGECNQHKQSFLGCFYVDKQAEGDYFLKTRGRSPFFLSD